MHDPRLLDTIFALSMLLLISRFAVEGIDPALMVAGLTGVVVVIVLWVLWRVRRAAERRSRTVALIFAAASIGLYLLSNSLSSLGLQWVAVLVLALELGIIASIAYTGAIFVVAVLLHGLVGAGFGQGLVEGIGAGLLLAVGVEFAVLLRRAERLDAERLEALAELERSNEQLASANDRLARANTELELAGEQQRLQHGREQDLVLAEERARVATALHDGLGHRLTAIGMSLDFSDRMRAKDPDRAASEVRTARATATEALDEMRRVVRAMHPVETDAGDVAGSLAAVAESFASTGLDVSFVRRGSGGIGPDAGLLLLRFAQEGLTNVVRHAGATRAELRLEHGRDSVRIEILDDGGEAAAESDLSEAAASVAEGFGIRTLRERAQASGGSLDVSPRGGFNRGFALAMTLPNEAGERGAADPGASGTELAHEIRAAS